MTKLVRVGTNINGQPTYYEDHGWGVTQVWGRSRYGKTSLARTLVCRIAQYRPVLIFDFYADWVGLRDYNWNVKNPQVNRAYETSMPERIEHLTIVNDPSFEISDFHRDSDWVSWGMPEQAAKAVASVAACRSAHNNNADRFEEILQSLPIDAQEAEMFEVRFRHSGLKPLYVFPQSKQSAVVRWQYLKGFFGTPKTIRHWGDFLLRKNHVVVNFDIRSDPIRGIAKARAFTGLILSQLLENMPNTNVSYLERIKPLIVLEEADKLLPKKDSDYESSVLSAVTEIAIKQQRSGCALIMITQDPDLMDLRVQRMYHSKLMGRVPKNTPDEELTQNLRWNPGSNFRQFVLLRENGRYEIFTPDFTPCR